MLNLYLDYMNIHMGSRRRYGDVDLVCNWNWQTSHTLLYRVIKYTVAYVWLDGWCFVVEDNSLDFGKPINRIMM